MNNRSGIESLAKPVILVVDRNAGVATGHHAHWFERLTTSLTAIGFYSRKSEPSLFPKSASNAQWYGHAIVAALASDASQLIFTAGDDALLPILRRLWKIRASGKPMHMFLFRMARQPRRFGGPTLVTKIAMLVVLRLFIANCRLYVLQMPVGTPPRWHRWFGLVPVLDSSGLEVRNLQGKTEARHAYDLFAPTNHQVLLVIGMLGRGKHVDTIVDAWQHSPVPDTSLVFVGEASEDMHSLLLRAAKKIPSLCYIPGRATDDDFDRLIEGADAVIALYRYSASSGVVLRALAMGTRVLVGGSTVFVRQLNSVVGVKLIGDVTAPKVSASLREVLRLPVVSPMKIDALDARIFPRPLVEGVRGLGQ